MLFEGGILYYLPWWDWDSWEDWESVPQVPIVPVVPQKHTLPQREEFRDDFGFGEVVGEAVGGADGEVVGLVGLAQFFGHGDGVVEVGERTVGIERPRGLLEGHRRMGFLDAEDVAEQVQPGGVLLGLLIAAGAPICREFSGGG